MTDEPADSEPTDGATTNDRTSDETRTDDRTTDGSTTNDGSPDGPSPDDGALEAATVERMVRTIRPEWELRGARAAEDGYHHVYHLEVATPAGTRECVLKGTPAGKPAQAGTEARLFEVLRTHTSVPVPAVYGVVDEHPALPDPYFLMESIPGEVLPRTETDAFEAETIQWIARASGRYLGEVHSLDALDGFGLVTTAPGHDLDGGVPSGSFDEIAVADPVEDWERYVRLSADPVLETLETTRFRDLTGEVRSAIDSRAAALSGPFESALGHVDNQVANHVLDREARQVTGLLEWGFTLATTPAYDLAFAIHSLAGGVWWLVPSTPNLEPLVRESLLEGYRTTGPSGAVAEFREHRELYELLTVVHSAANFADRLELDGVDGATVEATATRHREVLEGHLQM